MSGRNRISVLSALIAVKSSSALPRAQQCNAAIVRQNVLAFIEDRDDTFRNAGRTSLTVRLYTHKYTSMMDH